MLILGLINRCIVQRSSFATLQNRRYFSRFSDKHQEGVEAIGETSAAGKSGTPASRLSEKGVAPILQASTTGLLHLPVKP